MPRALKHWTVLGISVPSQQWILLGLLIALSVVLSCVVPIESAKWVIEHAGYWQMLVLVVGTLCYAFAYAKERRPVYRRWFAQAKLMKVAAVGLLLISASAFMHLQFPHDYKVLADEATQMNTSQALQQYRLVYTPGTAQYRNGIFLVGEGYVDKRPYLFPFLLSIGHDLTGYRYTNSIWFNALLTPGIVCLFFLLGRRIHRRAGGPTAVLLAVGVPIFAHTATGGGFEPLNLFLILGVLYFAPRVWQRPSMSGIGLLVGGACLLGYARYESALYLLPSGTVIGFALRRARFLSLPWSLHVAPLICVPLVWLQRIAFSAEGMYFQLGYKQDPSAFSISFLRRNLESAWDFFVVPDQTRLSSPLITLIGTAGACYLVCNLVRRGAIAATRRLQWSLAAFGVATAINMVLFVFFNYGQYGDYITQRISVPPFAILILCGAYGLGHLRLRCRVGFAVGIGLLNLIIFYFPAAHGNFCSMEYVNGKDFRFVQDVSRQLGDAEGIFVYSHNRTAWLCARRPGFTLREAEKDPDKIYQVLASKSYDRVLVHVYQCGGMTTIADIERNRPPVWFDRVEKRLIAQRWLSSGISVAVFEFIRPIAISRNDAGVHANP